MQDKVGPDTGCFVCLLVSGIMTINHSKMKLQKKYNTTLFLSNHHANIDLSAYVLMFAVTFFLLRSKVCMKNIGKRIQK